METLFLETESDFGKAEIFVRKFKNTARVYVCDGIDTDGEQEARIFLNKADALRLIATLDKIAKELE